MNWTSSLRLVAMSMPSRWQDLARWLADHVGSRAVVRNVQWLFLEKVLRIAIGILVGAWVARHLGPERFGALSYVVALVSIFQAVCQLGLDSIVVRDLAQDPARARVTLGTTLALRLTASLAAFCVAVLAITILRPGDRESLWLTVLISGGLLFQVADTVDLWFQSQLQSRLTVLAKLLVLVTSNFLRVVAILAGADVLVFGALLLLEVTLGAAVIVAMYRKLPVGGTWVWQVGVARRMMSEAWPLLTAALAVLLYMRLDQIMLREMVGERALGVFVAAQHLSAAWYFLPMILCMSVGPELARLHTSDLNAYHAALRRLFRLCWILSLSISALTLVFAELMVRLMFGPAYAEAAEILRWHVLSLAPVSLGIAQSLWITHERRPSLALYRTVIGLVVSVSLNLLLIPRMGAKGAAIAYFCCQFSACILSNALLAPGILRLQISSLLPTRFSRQ